MNSKTPQTQDSFSFSFYLPDTETPYPNARSSPLFRHHHDPFTAGESAGDKVRDRGVVAIAGPFSYW